MHSQNPVQAVQIIGFLSLPFEVIVHIAFNDPIVMLNLLSVNIQWHQIFKNHMDNEANFIQFVQHSVKDYHHAKSYFKLLHISKYAPNRDLGFFISQIQPTDPYTLLKAHQDALQVFTTTKPLYYFGDDIIKVIQFFDNLHKTLAVDSDQKHNVECMIQSLSISWKLSTNPHEFEESGLKIPRGVIDDPLDNPFYKLFVNVRGVNLNGMTLRNQSLAGWNLYNAILSHCFISNVSFENANLTKTQLDNVKMSHCSLTLANCTLSSFKGATFSHVSVQRANFCCANLSDSTFNYPYSLDSALVIGANLNNIDVKLLIKNLSAITTGKDYVDHLIKKMQVDENNMSTNCMINLAMMRKIGTELLQNLLTKKGTKAFKILAVLDLLNRIAFDRECSFEMHVKHWQDTPSTYDWKYTNLKLIKLHSVEAKETFQNSSHSQVKLGLFDGLKAKIETKKKKYKPNTDTVTKIDEYVALSLQLHAKTEANAGSKNNISRVNMNG